ncbi:unnamed protein product [Plutella xylostella]|uniref:(diamondback moth) hypothetical protein n=1 Tax=Plutella xylostella TaxID=51655 RepID=A0A8S4G344_PLUXY|nr:unnamed protein product [Plutella xylostella]
MVTIVSDIGHNIVQDAFLIAVEEQARQRLQRLSALKRITPVDMSQLSVELNRRKLAQTTPENRTDLNGYISSSTVYVTSITEDGAIETKPIISSPKPTIKSLQAKPTPVIANGISIDNKKDTDAPEPEKHEKDTSEKVKSEVISESDAYSAVREQLSNGRSEKLIGEQPENRIRATAVIENNKLGPGEKGPRRRSGSSIVVLDADEDKRPPDDDQNMIAMLSVTADTGPHREMAVDVPDSFIARNKTPPRYPPRGPRSSGLSFGSKKSKASTETTKCGDLFRMDTPSDHKVQLLISNGDDSLLDVRGVSYSARTDSVLIREAMYASYQLPPGFDTTPVLLGREVAVDVPDSFVQIVKTTPKYPSTDRKIEAFHKVMGIGHAAACCDGQ